MIPAGFRLIEVEETTSTNNACLEAARAGDPGNLWIRADRQSAGRGSRSRQWVSQSGNLFASLLLEDPGPTHSLANLTFVAALAVRDALARLATAHRVDADLELKWPNDVLLAGKKVSGILLEHHTLEGRTVVIIGIGINCASHPDGTTHPATDLGAEGMSVPPRDMLELLADSLATWLDRWERGARFDIIRQAWLDHASGVGRPLVARLPTRDIEGVFEDLDRQGQLVLRLNDGETITVATADVFFANTKKAEV